MEPLNQQPAPASAPMAAEHKKIGPIITLLVIVLILIIGALYLFASRVNNTPAQESTISSAEEVTPVTNQSDDMESIEADLGTSIDGVDKQNF